MAAGVALREITDEEGNRLLRIVRRTSGSVVTWRRAQIVLLSAQGMTPTGISEVVHAGLLGCLFQHAPAAATVRWRLLEGLATGRPVARPRRHDRPRGGTSSPFPRWPPTATCMCIS